MGFLGEDHLVEIHGQESEHPRCEHHHAELEDSLVVSFKQVIQQRGQCQKPDAEQQAQRKAQRCTDVDLPAELVVHAFLQHAILFHLLQEL